MIAAPADAPGKPPHWERNHNGTACRRVTTYNQLYVIIDVPRMPKQLHRRKSIWVISAVFADIYRGRFVEQWWYSNCLSPAIIWNAGRAFRTFMLLINWWSMPKSHIACTLNTIAYNEFYFHICIYYYVNICSECKNKPQSRAGKHLPTSSAAVCRATQYKTPTIGSSPSLSETATSDTCGQMFVQWRCSNVGAFLIGLKFYMWCSKGMRSLLHLL